MIHGEVVIKLRVSLIILPHSAVGGFAPSPRKLNAASSIIIVPISSIAVTKMGPMMFGRICLKMSFAVLLPDSFAAFIQTVSFCASVWLRAMRAYFGHEIAASAMIAFCSPPPKEPATASANTRPGNARNISDMRMSTVSIHRPCQPQNTPTTVPSTVMTTTSRSVENMLARLPTITRESMSLP